MPRFMDLGWGNVDCLQVAMLVAYLALRAGRGGRGTLVAGAVLGLAILFKPNLALIVPLVGLELLLARRWRDATLQVAGLAIAGAAALAVTAIRFGSARAVVGVARRPLVARPELRTRRVQRAGDGAPPHRRGPAPPTRR